MPTVNDYCTVQDVTSTLVDITITAKDTTAITSAVNKASRRIDMFTGRPEGAYYAVDIHTLYYDGGTGLAVQYLFGPPSGYNIKKRATRVRGSELRLDEMVSVTEVAFSLDGRVSDPSYYTVLDATKDYILEDYNAPDFNRPYTRLRLNIQEGAYAIFPPFMKAIRVKGIQGYSGATPVKVKSVAIALAARYWKRGKEAYQSGMTKGSGDDKVTTWDKMDLDILEDLAYLSRLAI
jgi:hypothetical protein